MAQCKHLLRPSSGDASTVTADEHNAVLNRRRPGRFLHVSSSKAVYFLLFMSPDFDSVRVTPKLARLGAHDEHEE